VDRETVEEMKRHFGVVAEGLRADVRAVAEGQQALRETFARELQAFRQEARTEFEEVVDRIEAAIGR
jgi:hypothetical protein